MSLYVRADEHEDIPYRDSTLYTHSREVSNKRGNERKTNGRLNMRAIQNASLAIGSRGEGKEKGASASVSRESKNLWGILNVREIK